MDGKVKTLQHEIDSVNPRSRIEQSILPRLERTRGIYSVEPEIYTSSGKRILKRPARLVKSGSRNDSSVDYHLDDDDDAKCLKFYYPNAISEEDLRRQKAKLELEKDNRKLKPIINNSVDESLSKLKLSNNSNEKKVCFEDDKKVDEELESEMVVKNIDESVKNE
jgi:hypothetical protein